MIIVDSRIIWFHLYCIMQLKKSYCTVTNVSSRKSATTIDDLPDCLYQVRNHGHNIRQFPNPKLMWGFCEVQWNVPIGTENNIWSHYQAYGHRISLPILNPSHGNRVALFDTFLYVFSYVGNYFGARRIYRPLCRYFCHLIDCCLLESFFPRLLDIFELHAYLES